MVKWSAERTAKSYAGPRGDKLEDFLTIPIPERKFLLEPLIPEPSITMMYSVAGLGKSMLALSIAHTIATGGEFGGFKAPEAQEVVYFDSEMDLPDIGPRLMELGRLKSTEGKLRVYTPDRMEEFIPDLATYEGREFIERRIGDAKLIVLDNLSTLFRANRENEASDWALTSFWLQELKHNGHSILLLHHAGKNGLQRGTSKREDVANTIISLKRIPGAKEDDECRFVMRFDKSRAKIGKKRKAVGLWYKPTPEGVAHWEREEGDFDPRKAEAERRSKEGESVRKIAANMGLSKSTVQRWLSEMSGEKDEW